MPLPVIADTCRFAVDGVTANGQPWTNVIHLGSVGGWSSSLVTTALDVVEALYATNTGHSADHGWAFFAAAPAQAQLITGTVLDGSSASQQKSIAINGTSAQQQLPGECALICSHATAERGPSKRGRTFWAAPYEGLTDADGTLTGSIATQVETGWAGWRSSLLDAEGLTHVVASYKLSDSFPVLDTIARGYFGHQDRRRR